MSKLFRYGVPTMQVRDLSALTRVIPEMTELHPDLMIGGPPCQDFSSANHKRKEGDRADLTAYAST